MLKTLSSILICTTIVCAVPSVTHAQVAEVIGEGIVRFDASHATRLERRPSIAMVRQFESIGDIDPDAHPLTPEFVQGRDGRYIASISIEDGTSLYGTGQVAGPLLRNGFVTETWNLDAFGYGLDAKNLYTSQPWVLAVREDGTAFGVLADTTERCEIDLRDGITFKGVAYQFPVIVIDRESPQAVMQGLAELTGTIAMPPRWAIGYHQCRYSYNPDSRVREVAETFRAKQLPADVIWMDIDYMDAYRVFTFDDEQFSDPKALNQYLDSIGFSNVWMIDPGVKKEDGYFV
ncbi:MAG TPA: alpha-glucosidase, partial [Phycisphaerales bacterium]|nr:alpha-glucosidase [Phycisphaerales bacterium]